MPAPVFLFMVDTCLAETELRALKDALVRVLGLLPQTALVGLMTVGATVQVYELAFAACPKAYVFTGVHDYTPARVRELLGLPQAPVTGHSGSRQPLQPTVMANNFLVPLSECEFTLTSILEDLQRDPWPVRSDSRPLLSTGAAISVALGLLEATCKGSAARLMCFIGGPCTQGPGAVVGVDLKEIMRSHTDVLKEKAKYTRKASRFYETLAARAAANCHAVDLFCCCIDQVGLFEFQDLCRKTGGIALMSDMFAKEVFQRTLLQLFERSADGDLQMAFCGTIEVQTTRDLKVSGAVGPLASLDRRGPNVADNELGVGGTCAWRACVLGPRTSYAFFFEVSGSTSSNGGSFAPASTANMQPGLIQFLTHYQTSSGQVVLRVSTVARAWTDTAASLQPLAESFDQETAAALVARIAVHKLDAGEEPYDVLRWIDRTLIRLVAKYADYRKDDPTSLRLSPGFTLFPQFCFHLRRSQFIQVFNSSPDESAFYRSALLRDNVPGALVMIQPTLDAYELGAAEPIPVLLSATSVATNRILLLDTFFTVVVFLGYDIVQARKEGLAEKPEGEAFRQLLAQPLADAQAIIKERFPSPRYIECAQYSGDARHLLSILDPAITHTTGNSASNPGAEAILTEDVSLQVFLDHLRAAAVKQ